MSIDHPMTDQAVRGLAAAAETGLTCVTPLGPRSTFATVTVAMDLSSALMSLP
jgi:hypothetical protein